jgi:hypothetical protein
MHSERYVRAGLCLALTLLAGACATARNDGTTVSKTVEIDVRTTPEGARCVLERLGKEIAVVDAAPETVTVDRGIRNINVTCDLEGHITTVEVLESRYVGGPVNTPYYGGNVAGAAIGSLIVMAIIAGSSANYEYPTAAYVTLQRNAFPDAESRELKYAELREAAVRRHEGRVIANRAQCSNNTEMCRLAEHESEKMRDVEFARLDEFKAKAVIAPEPPAKAQEQSAPKKAG